MNEILKKCVSYETVAKVTFLYQTCNRHYVNIKKIFVLYALYQLFFL